MIKNPSDDAGDIRDVGLIPGSRRYHWRRAWQPTPVFLPWTEEPGRKFHGQHGPQGCKELDTTEAT